MGGGLLRTNNQQERKTKKLLGILGIGLVIGVVNVNAITSNEVTYDNQGVTENLTETLDKLYSELKEYKTSGSVTSTEMLEGSTGYAKGKLVTGSIKRKEAQTYIPGTTDQTISSGQYLNGDQIIKGDVHLVASNIKSGISLFGVAGTFTSDANAEANQILSGKTAYVKGNKITGSIGSKGSTTYTPGVNNQTISKGQYLSENQTILGDADLKAANIKNGVEIFGVTGTFTSDANAIANQILSGKTAYVKGNKITGSMSNKAGATVTASTTTSDATYTYVTIPAAGYYDTSSKVRTENTKLNNGLIGLTLVDTYLENTEGSTGTNDFYFTPSKNGIYTIIAYATGNKANTAIYKNDVDISNSFLRDTGNFSSAFTILSVYLNTTDKIKIHVQNYSAGGYRQYWIYH